MFTNLLIQTCDIQEKSLALNGYEQTPSWSVIASSVKCRKDSKTSAKISDTNIRINTDDDMFFFNPDITIIRGNRIVLDSENYDVIKVNKVYDDEQLHHIEVIARLTDHK